MKNKKKHSGIKHKIREEKKKRQRIGLAVTVAILIITVSVSGFLINSMLNQPSTNQTTSNASQPKAAIVDHLSLTTPNQTFIEKATTILEQAGYTVDYYSGENVTVEFYGNLPTHGYGLIILRVHSAITVDMHACLFTSEVSSKTRYVYEQLTGRLAGAKFSHEETVYFAISPLFVVHSMKGTFQNTTIIQMGCDGLAHTTMAEAFRQKGAKVYISWTGDVLASHTDQATTQLLKHLLTEKQTIEHAVTETMKEVGPDPTYKSLLIYYPLEAGDKKAENITGNPTTRP